MCGLSEKSGPLSSVQNLRSPESVEVGGGGGLERGTIALNGDQELFLVYGSGYLGREKSLLGWERRQNPE